LRFRHHQEVLEARPVAAWFEVHTENYVGGGARGGLDRSARLSDLASRDGLSLGSAEGLTGASCTGAGVVERVEPGLVSEHLSSASRRNYSPIFCAALTKRRSNRLPERRAGSGSFEAPDLVENPPPSAFRHSTFPMGNFSLGWPAHGLRILCDVIHIYVSSCNHVAASAYVAALACEAWARSSCRHQFSVGGSTAANATHRRSRLAVARKWGALHGGLARFGPVPTLIEWDTDVRRMACCSRSGDAFVLIEEAKIGLRALAA